MGTVSGRKADSEPAVFQNSSSAASTKIFRTWPILPGISTRVLQQMQNAYRLTGVCDEYRTEMRVIHCSCVYEFQLIKVNRSTSGWLLVFTLSYYLSAVSSWVYVNLHGIADILFFTSFHRLRLNCFSRCAILDLKRKSRREEFLKMLCTFWRRNTMLLSVQLEPMR